MKTIAAASRCLLLAGLGVAGPALAEVILVQGSEGEPEFREAFADAVETFREASESGGAPVSIILPEGNDQLYRFHLALDAVPRQAIDPLWLVFVGHGTYDQRDAKIALDGEDLSSVELAERLADFERPVFILALASASGPFILELSAPDRIVVTATKSGREVNYSRFAGYFAEALTEGEADLDNDGQNSVLECFIYACRQTDAFYETQGRIITEHALLDDNGDRRGSDFRTLSLLYDGLPAGDEIDGLLARQWALIPSEEERNLDPETRQRRNALEQKLFLLNQERANLEEDAYYGKLEELMVQLAELYRSAAATGGAEEPSPETPGAEEPPPAADDGEPASGTPGGNAPPPTGDSGEPGPDAPGREETPPADDNGEAAPETPGGEEPPASGEDTEPAPESSGEGSGGTA